MASVVFDLRDAFRSLRRDRSYAATVIVTLALTIGATTAVFSIVDGVLLRPLAYRESHQLVDLRETWRQFASQTPAIPVNEQHFEYWRSNARSFDSLAQYVGLAANLTGAGDARQITLVRASGALFNTLGIQAAIGRTLTTNDEGADKPAVTVLADGLWRERFGADRAIVGRPIILDGKPHTVVGVLPAGVELPGRARSGDRFDAVVPIRMAEEHVGWVGDHNNAAVGRLKRGVSPEQAQADLDVLQLQVGARASQEAHEPVTLGSVVVPLVETVVGQARRGLLLLSASIGAVLLIACSNLTNLSLARTMARERDSAIRSALGASRLRLVARALLEQLTLSIAGGAAGVGVAWTALAVFVRTAPIDVPRASEVSLDGRVLGFAAVVSTACGLLIALLPAWRTSGGGVQGALKAGVTASTGDRRATRTRSTLLALQVGLSVTLLFVTALLSLSFLRLVRVDRGFNADRVLAVGLALPAGRYADGRVRLAAYDRVLAAIQTLPGVESATTTSILPLTGEGQVNFIAAEGDRRPRSERATANFRFVAPGFFRTIGVPVLRGRSFFDSERDPGRPAPAVISERTAAVLWPGRNPLGQRFSRGEADEQGFEVVGVVADARTTSIERTPPLMVYAPYWWRSRPTTSLLIKSAADPALLLAGLRRAVQQIDSEIAIGQPRTLQALVDASFAARRYQMQLFLAFGAVALLMATLGVYAVTAYGVSRRRREMNIRVALGAQPSQVVRLVVGQSSRPVLVGIAAGVVGALGIGGVVAGLLFDVRARDPLVLAGVSALVGGIGLATSLIAARRGLSLNPAAALRDE